MRRALLLLWIATAGCAGLIGLGDYSVDGEGGGVEAGTSSSGTTTLPDGRVIGPGDDSGSNDGGPDAPNCGTTLRGTIRDPRGVNVIPNAIVYVPKSTPAAFPSGPRSCDTCAGLMTGEPITTAVTNERGAFVLPNVPAGRSFPLVFLTGRWRRQITVDAIPACTEGTLPDAKSTLPKNHTEGDLPKIAIVSGQGDAQHCVLRRFGVDESEFTGGDGAGRVHVYSYNGASFGGPPATNLWNDTTRLSTYDLVMESCDNTHGAGPAAGPITTPPNPLPNPSQLANLKAYLDSGGRLFASHWMANDLAYGAWPMPNGPLTGEFGSNLDGDRGPPPLPYTIDTSTPLGRAMAALPDAGATIALENWRHITIAVKSGASSTLHADSTQPPVSHPQNNNVWGGPHVGSFEFDTPWPGGHCGRMTAISGHATAGTNLPSFGGCEAADRPMTTDEHVAMLLWLEAGACLGAPLP